jgi:hypothetical protein
MSARAALRSAFAAPCAAPCAAWLALALLVATPTRDAGAAEPTLATTAEERPSKRADDKPALVDTSAAGYARRGMDLYALGRYEAARAELTRSVEALPTPRVVAWLLLTLSQLGACDEVAERARWLNPAELDATLRAGLEVALGPQGRCPLPPGVRYRCDGKVDVTTSPTGAMVSSAQRGDGQAARTFGPSPVHVDGLCPGSAVIRAEAWRHAPAARVLTIAPGGQRAVHLELEPESDARFFDRYRKTGVLGASLSVLRARREGRPAWAFADAASVGVHVHGMIMTEFRAGAGLHALRTPAVGGGDNHALIARLRGEWTLPLWRRLPLPGADARWLSLAFGAGGDAMLGTPRGVLGFVDASVHLLWLTLRAHAGMGWGLGSELGLARSAGVEVTCALYL